MLTNTIRVLDDDTEDFFHKNATSAGIDFTQYFGDKEYIFQMKTAFSNIQGNENAIDRTQRSAIHNFQRPDADYVEYDPTRTSLNGFGGNLMTGKIGGNFNIFYLSAWKSPGLEMNDIGYMRVADQYIGAGIFSYSIYKPFSIFNQMYFGTNIIHAHDFSGKLTNIGEELSWQAYFKNLWSVYIGGQVYGEETDNHMLRGGPSMKMPGNAGLHGGISTNRRKKFSVELDGNYGWGFEDVYKDAGISLELNYKPFSTLSLSVEPELEKMLNTMQYVTETSATSGVYTPRYIFGSIDQKILSMSLRVDYNITPDLTIQYWGQPFFGSGDYEEFKYITDPVADEYTDRFHTYLPGEISFDETDGTYFVDENIDGAVDYLFENPDFTVSGSCITLLSGGSSCPVQPHIFVWSQTREYFTDVEHLTLGTGY
jgi:hypothetical protein